MVNCLFSDSSVILNVSLLTSFLGLAGASAVILCL